MFIRFPCLFSNTHKLDCNNNQYKNMYNVTGFQSNWWILNKIVFFVPKIWLQINFKKWDHCRESWIIYLFKWETCFLKRNAHLVSNQMRLWLTFEQCCTFLSVILICCTVFNFSFCLTFPKCVMWSASSLFLVVLFSSGTTWFTMKMS